MSSKRLVAILAYPVINAFESVVDNYMRDTISEPAIGSIVYCDLFLGYCEHSGIYIGNDEIIHLNKKGIIEKVDLKNFIKSTTALSIYASCIDSEAMGNQAIAQRALDFLLFSEQRNYHVILDNCHQFTSSCITGNSENSDSFLWMLKHTASKELSISNWRVWKR
ncbi:MAG: hypothetical protein JJV99_11775 [Colwellia sp.]|nr:hypothetical protein [Colwellia sp.]